jgi:hypothetical protein
VLFGGGALIFVAVMALLALSLRRHGGRCARALWIAGAGIAFPVVVLTRCWCGAPGAAPGWRRRPRAAR